MKFLKSRKKINAKTKFLLSALLPFIALFLLFKIFPIIRLFTLSTQDGFLKAMGRPSWVGFNFYLEAFHDDLFWISLKNSLVYTGIYVTIIFSGSFLIALGLSKVTKKLRDNLLLCYYSPLMTNIAAAGVLFIYFYEPQFGLFNFLLSCLHLPRLGWLADPKTALFSVVIVEIWRNLGFFSIIFLAGIQNIPSVYIEAAEIDGAGLWKKFFYVTIPLLKPTILLILAICTINAMKVFEPIYVLTTTSAQQPGGPLDSTNVMALNIYNTAFKYSRLGYGSALGIILLAIVGIFMYFQVRIMKTTWEY